jgi:uncharacterized protein DUF29
MSTPADLYEQDFYAWTQAQAALLRAGDVAALDHDHVAEELESMGRRERHELIHRLAVVLIHLLKWQHQPSRRGRSWQLTIKEQRRQTARVLQDNPSLKAHLDQILIEAYGDAVIGAARETGLDEAAFPASCPFSLEQLLSDSYWPGGSSA